MKVLNIIQIQSSILRLIRKYMAVQVNNNNMNLSSRIDRIYAVH